MFMHISTMVIRSELKHTPLDGFIRSNSEKGTFWIGSIVMYIGWWFGESGLLYLFVSSQRPQPIPFLIEFFMYLFLLTLSTRRV